MDTQDFMPITAVDYLCAVESNLTGLSASDRSELIDELRTHLAELLIEDQDIKFESVLGTPEQYAAELLVAGGFAEAEKRTTRRFKPWVTTVTAIAAILGAFWLGAASLIWHDNWELGQHSTMTNPDHFVNTPVLVGLPVQTAYAEMLQQGIQLCPEVNKRILDWSKAVVAGQAPVSDEVINTEIQCVFLTFTPDSYLPGAALSFMPTLPTS